MGDEVTSTDRKIVYKIRLSPNGEEYMVEAGSAVSAHQKGMGLAALDEVYYNSMQVFKASENDITDFYGHDEEE